MGQLALLSLPIVVGLSFGKALGGHVRAITTTPLHALGLLWLAAGVQLVGLLVGVNVLVVVFASVLLWLILNLRDRTAMVRLALCGVLAGLIANGSAIMAGGGRMPYAPASAAAAGIDPTVATSKNVPGDGLLWLGDAIPLPAAGAVVSIGDVLIAVGVGVLVTALMRPRERKEVNP